MKPWINVATAPGPDGQPLTLQQRDGVYAIRAGGHVLMSSAQHGSEEAMAITALKALPGPAARVLIGGLGLGFTLRATLDRLAPEAAVVVAEISQAVVDWCRQLASLSGGAPLDPRVTVRVEDIGALLAANTEPYDAVLLDVDNGPSALSRRGNQQLYGSSGLRAFRQALKPGGVLVVWSAGPDPRFAQKLGDAGFEARTVAVPARAGSGARHTLFVARVTSPRRPSSSRTSERTSATGHGRSSGRRARPRRTR